MNDRIHFHVVDYKRDRPGRTPLLHKKFAAWLYGPNEQNIAGGHVEVLIGRTTPSVEIHLGGEGSETPFNAHLALPGIAIYTGARFGRWSGKLASRLTHPRGERHEYVGRSISAFLANGTVYWNIWAHDSLWERDEFPAWRHGSKSVNPLDYILGGPKRYAYTDVEKAHIDLQLHDGVYPVTLKLQRRKFGRPRGRSEEGWSVDWGARRGIPSHFDRSGGWKGDRTYGSGFDIPSDRDWVNDATERLRAWVYEQRAKTGFREAQPQDDAA